MDNIEDDDTSDTHKILGEWQWNSDLLWSKIVQTGEDECWQWLGARGPQTNLFGARKAGKAQMTQARRLLFRDVTGEDCDDQRIKMKCKNAYCMNWHHFDTMPNQRKFYDDGVQRGHRQAVDPTQGLKRVKLKRIRADWE